MLNRLNPDRKALLPFLAGMPVAFVVSLLVAFFYSPESSSFETLPTVQVEIRVSIVGAVATPGVYAVSDSSRILDVVNAAGGFTEDADTDQLNLAQRVEDEETVRIPFTGSATPIPDGFGIVNINTASFAELDSLPGIGEVLANRIIAYRMEHGGFSSIEELANIEGISNQMVEELRQWITV